MFESIKGQLIEKTPLRAVVETAGIGYRLSIGLNTYTRLPLSGQVQLFLSQIVREDAHTLYAFVDKEERDLFETLITISGIGPKTALAITGHLDLNVLQRAIQSSDIKLLSKIPGIGKKTAERLVIEMRDKIKGGKEKGQTLNPGDGLLGDCINALLNLGYPPMQAQKAVQAAMQAQKDETDLGKILRAALQNI